MDEYGTIFASFLIIVFPFSYLKKTQASLFTVLGQMYFCLKRDDRWGTTNNRLPAGKLLHEAGMFNMDYRLISAINVPTDGVLLDI